MRVIHVLRKPLSEPSVAANVLKHGTGALNIDKCRIATEEDTERTMGHNAYLLRGGAHGSIIASHQTDESKLDIRVRRHRPNREHIAAYLREARERKGLSRNATATALGVGTMYYAWETEGDGNKLPTPETWWKIKEFLGFDDRFDAEMTEMMTIRRNLRSGGGGGGRWPANLILEHLPECRNVGTKRVKGSVLNQTIQRSRSVSKSIGEQTNSHCQGYTDANGISAWECAPGCPVAALDRQSGHLHARGNIGPAKGGDGMYGHGPCLNDFGAGDAGGASRFFKQVGGNNDV